MPKQHPSEGHRGRGYAERSGSARSLYTRGKFRLWYDEGRSGEKRSPNLYIFFYDEERQRVRGVSTGTPDVEQARLKLDALYEAQQGFDPHFCPACGRPLVDGNSLAIATVLADYWEDVGRKRASASSIHARIKHLLDWLEDEDREEMTCGQFDNSSAAAFRAWSRETLVIVNDKVRPEPRSPATTEESLHTLHAAFRHAKALRKLDVVPEFDTLGRSAVSNPIVVRVGLPTLAEMLRYAAELHRQREPLHAFLVASICTLARPGAVLDISVCPTRRQWYPGSPVLRLNPHGRLQTKKRRPDVWVPPQFAPWLEARLTDRSSGGWLVHRGGRKVKSIDTAWDSMRADLGFPQGIEYGSYIIRRSMATILRNWHKQGGTMVDYRELQEQMGHARQTTTDVYALNELSAETTVQRAMREVLAELERLAPGTLNPPQGRPSPKAGRRSPAGLPSSPWRSLEADPDLWTVR